MFTISVINRKGGCGKTTIAVHTAERLARSGAHGNVLLLDIDQQASACSSWGKRASDAQVVIKTTDSDKVARAVQVAPKKYDLMVIDCLPRHDSAHAEILALSDLAVIPLIPGRLDVDGGAATIKAAQEAGTPFVVVLNSVPVSSNREADALRKVLSKRGVDVAPVCIRTRTSYRRAFDDGKLAGDIDSRARHEMASLVKYLQTKF